MKRQNGKGWILYEKTEYIELLEDTKSYAFFLRARRFGKSLFTSVLEYYYGLNYADDFERLFGNTYRGTVLLQGFLRQGFRLSRSTVLRAVSI